MTKIHRRSFAAAGAAFVLAAPAIVSAQKKYSPGVTDKEIKLGHTNPYSGPLSAYGTIGKAIAAAQSQACQLQQSPRARAKVREGNSPKSAR